MTTGTVTGLYDSYDAAARTVRDLEAAHISDSDISLIGHRTDAYDAPGNAATGAGTGASAGPTIGGGVGLLAGLGILAIPGVGPVVAAGWLAATAVGAIAGAAAGGARTPRVSGHSIRRRPRGPDRSKPGGAEASLGFRPIVVQRQRRYCYVSSGGVAWPCDGSDRSPPVLTSRM